MRRQRSIKHGEEAWEDKRDRERKKWKGRHRRRKERAREKGTIVKEQNSKEKQEMK